VLASLSNELGDQLFTLVEGKLMMVSQCKVRFRFHHEEKDISESGPIDSGRALASEIETRVVSFDLDRPGGRVIGV